MNSSPDLHIAHLIDIARQIMERLPDSDVKTAFLFGSVAWGDADKASDLDIMLLLDRPAGYREVTRVRLADFFGHPLPDGPDFADFDRISVETFMSNIQAGAWAYRIVNSIILADTDGFYAQLRARVSATFLHPSACKERFLIRQKQAEESREAALSTLGTDALFSALHARLALQHAGAALIDLNGNRVSPGHFVESLEKALDRFNEHLFAPCLKALTLDARYEAVDRSLRAYDTFANTLKQWVDDPAIRSLLSQEDLAWSRHTYEKQEEITHKVAAFTRTQRLPALLYYLDGLFQVPICIQFGKIFQLRAGEKAERMTIPDFHIALRQEPILYDEWIAALRLSTQQDRILETIELVNEILDTGRATLTDNTH